MMDEKDRENTYPRCPTMKCLRSGDSEAATGQTYELVDGSLTGLVGLKVDGIHVLIPLRIPPILTTEHHSTIRMHPMCPSPPLGPEARRSLPSLQPGQLPNPGASNVKTCHLPVPPYASMVMGSYMKLPSNILQHPPTLIDSVERDQRNRCINRLW